MSIDHELWMRYAFLEALRSKGTTGKNPNVGCVVIKNNKIIATGRTSYLGRPHAEENVIKNIGFNKKLENSSIYMSLEPCAHKNSDGTSCAEMLAKNNIKEIFISNLDPDPRTSGKGIEILKKSGIKVVVNFLKEEGEEINAGFFSRLIKGRPKVTVKIAISLDGKIALSNNVSKWITNDLSRKYVHFLRSQSDAVLTSSNTIIKDNPSLTVRLPGLNKLSPLKIVVDRKSKVNKNFNINKSFYQEKTIIYQNYINNKVNKGFSKLPTNIEYKSLKKIIKNKNYFWDYLLADISTHGINNLMIESGPIFTKELFKQRYVDEIALFRSSKIIGNDGIPFVSEFGFKAMSDLLEYRIIEQKRFDDDIFEIRRLVD